MTAQPTVSVLMYAFRHQAFIHRALESLLAQEWQDWELIVLDDASPDDTQQLVPTTRADRRVRYERFERHRGMGAALNHGLQQARGRYIAYLPADDLFYPEHLARLVALLQAQPHAVAAYGDARWGNENTGPQPALAENGHATIRMVQVVHRHIPGPRWIAREERVTDMIEALFWQELTPYGSFIRLGAATCEWVDHSFKWVRLIATPGGGLARYRQFYNLGRDVWLDFQPSRGMPINEHRRYGRFACAPAPKAGGLKILMVGELGFNPERIVALEEHGHTLYGMWQRDPESWNTTGPFAYGNIEDIPFDRNWRDAVRAIQPDVIYGLLNFFALPMVAEVLDAGLGIPLVFHFKEGPFLCLQQRLWPTLVRVLCESDGLVFISPENRAWFERAVGPFDPRPTLVLDGDLPKRDWMTDDWAPKVSAATGELHTVCAGRAIGLEPFAPIAAAGMHVHFYTGFSQPNPPDWVERGMPTGFMHIHPPVEPNDWTRELSQYDAAWLHVFRPSNGGDLRRARWDDLNLPARLGTYAAAGLPWILADCGDSVSAVHNLARQHRIGVFFNTYADLAAQLADHRHMARLTANARASREQFAFDTHVPALVDFFRRVIAWRITNNP